MAAVPRWMRDPFLHFVGLGLLLFALYHLVAPSRPAPPGTRIVLTNDDLRQMEYAWAAKWQRPPTQAELQDLVEAKVREEVLYREALALGLEQDDEIVKRRLAQKLEFLTEDVGAIRDPTPQELEAWFQRNAAQFAVPGRVTFRHVYFSPDRRGGQSSADAGAVLVGLTGQASVDPSTLGDRFFDRDYYADRTPDQVASVFGLQFAHALFLQRPGAWQGPIESGLGWHLVRVEAVTPSHIPGYAEVDRDAVRAAWIDAQRDASKRNAYDAMRSKYEVVLPGAERP
jgi:hypothetical protein